MSGHSGTPLYERHLSSAAWARKREQRLAIDGNKCQACLHEGQEWRLEIHHKTYERLGDEDVERDLITLCSQCHEAITSVIRSRRYDGKPVPVGCVSESSSSRKDVEYGMEDRFVSDHGRRTADSSQWGSRKPVEQGR